METSNTRSYPKYVKFNTLFIFSLLFLYGFSIYSCVIFLKISQTFSDSQPTNAILLLVLELTSLIGLFTVETHLIDRESKHKEISTIMCSIIIVLVIDWVPRSFTYIEIYQYITNEENKNNSHYDYLKIQLFISTILHSISVLFNFIMTGIGMYYKKKEEAIINNDTV